MCHQGPLGFLELKIPDLSQNFCEKAIVFTTEWFMQCVNNYVRHSL